MKSVRIYAEIELIPLGMCLLWSMSDEMDRHMVQGEIMLRVVTYMASHADPHWGQWCVCVYPYLHCKPFS